MPLSEDLKNTADDCGLVLVNLPLATYRLPCAVSLPDHVISERIAPARFALAYPALQAPMRLMGEILQEERIHGPVRPTWSSSISPSAKRNQLYARK